MYLNTKHGLNCNCSSSLHMCLFINMRHQSFDILRVLSFLLINCKKVRMAMFKGGLCKMVSSFLDKSGGRDAE